MNNYEQCLILLFSLLCCVPHFIKHLLKFADHFMFNIAIKTFNESYLREMQQRIAKNKIYTSVKTIKTTAS